MNKPICLIHLKNKKPFIFIKGSVMTLQNYIFRVSQNGRSSSKSDGAGATGAAGAFGANPLGLLLA